MTFSFVNFEENLLFYYRRTQDYYIALLPMRKTTVTV